MPCCYQLKQNVAVVAGVVVVQRNSSMRCYVQTKEEEDDSIGDDIGGDRRSSSDRKGMDNMLMECMDNNDRHLVLLLPYYY